MAGKPKKQGVRLKGTKEFRVDHFRLLPAKRLKNVGWRANQPKLISEEHVHYFHSYDGRTGSKNDKSEQMGLHWHKVEIEWEEDKDGNASIKSAKCGPALIKREVRVGARDLPVTKFSPIRWRTKTSPDMEDDVIDLDAEELDWVYDNHTHELEYLDSEMMDMNTSKAVRDRNREQISRATNQAIPSTQGAASQKLATSAAAAPAKEQ